MKLTKVLKIDEVFCLTDAEVVLNWVQRKDKMYKQFVQNRVVEIRKHVPGDSWYHVPGTENIADLPSRGCTPKKLEEPEVIDRWLFGPTWLQNCFEDWPIRKEIKYKYDDPELKKEAKEKKCLINCNSAKLALQEIIDIKRFSTLERLIRVTAWCRRFVFNCNRIVKEEKKGEIDAEEYEDAESRWIRSVQIEMQSESGYVKRCQSLGLFNDNNGDLRCRGRIGKANVRFGTKVPLLLPTNHRLTELMIIRAHERVYHNGVKETLDEIRFSYWIIKGRQMVKKIIRCFLCKTLEGMAYPSPVTCDLPEFRVKSSRVFETAGVDFCGPVYVKPMYKTNNETNKAYIAITTCATSRFNYKCLLEESTKIYC